jgi:WD40 repeat protein
MTLENGSAAVYDVEKRKNIFCLEPNHSNTIFDIKYSPLLYGVFATCSYVSIIKIWDLTQNKIISNIDID